jgi:hypothetical protein
LQPLMPEASRQPCGAMASRKWLCIAADKKGQGTRLALHR